MSRYRYPDSLNEFSLMNMLAVQSAYRFISKETGWDLQNAWSENLPKQFAAIIKDIRANLNQSPPYREQFVNTYLLVLITR